MPEVVGGVVEVAPAPCPDAPVVPGLPVPLWPLPLVPIELPLVVLLAPEPPAPDPVAELPPISPLLMPVVLHAARNSTAMLPMRMP